MDFDFDATFCYNILDYIILNYTILPYNALYYKILQYNTSIPKKKQKKNGTSVHYTTLHYTIYTTLKQLNAKLFLGMFGCVGEVYWVILKKEKSLHSCSLVWWYLQRLNKR